MARRPAPPSAWLLAGLLVGWLGASRAQPARAAEVLTVTAVEVEGEIRAVRHLDLDGDGRPDLVVLWQPAEGAPGLTVLRSPPEGREAEWFGPAYRHPIALAGDLATAGALCLGRFGPGGEGRLRFLGPGGAVDLDASGRPAPGAAPRAPPTLLARSAGRPLVLWDGVADLDGDGVEECWFPLAAGEGALFVLGGRPEGDRRLSLTPTNRGISDGAHALYRYTYVPNLVAADLDGDGRRELLALKDGRLLGWDAAGPAPSGGVLEPGFSLAFPFLEPDPTLGPEEMRTPRLQIADVDGDGRADLLVSLLVGRRDQLGSVRTILYHFPGPFRDATTGALTKPRGRIDTESVALHPTFVDLDGDGTREYVGDAIRGTTLELLARMAGRDSEIHLTGYGLAGPEKTFAARPLFTLKRPYASSEAMSNRFGRSAWFEGDFDGDGRRDLLDLGNLERVEILRGRPAEDGRGIAFGPALFGPRALGGPLAADARIADLDGDGRSDAVLWSGRTLYLLRSGAGK